MPLFYRIRKICRTPHFVLVTVCACLLCSASATWAAGTRVGTLIESIASVDFTQNGEQQAAQSTAVGFVVAERLDVAVTRQSGQVVVSPGDVDRALLFTVTNLGNGDEVFRLSLDNAVAGNDFDPVSALPDAIYFDTDGSGDFNVGDVAYSPGTNDPDLAPDESIGVFIVNDIPGGAVDGQLGRSELAATAATGSGTAGTVYPTQGDGGVDAVVGVTTATATEFGDYIVDDVAIDIVKSQVVTDADGGSAPIVGATITYTITVAVVNSGTATATVISDPIPTWSTFVPGSITLNGNTISDATDGDSGEYDITAAPTVVVRLGDLAQADGVQNVVFQVTID
jgi:uncharacterized repeat protein (TIGR01451 family)